MSQKPRQENSRKNLVNTVQFYRKTEKTAKGPRSEKITCDVGKHKLNRVHFKCITMHFKKLSCEGKDIRD